MGEGGARDTFKCPNGLYRDVLVINGCERNMTLLSEQASWAKMMSLGEKLTAPACHPTKFVNKAE